MNAAIIGLPQSGKTTLFAAATGVPADPAEMPHMKRAIVQVPDPRLEPLAKIFESRKATPATIEFLDFPGFSLADAHGRDLFRKHLPDIRQADLLVVVVRDFANPAVPPYRNRVDPAADLTEVWDELIFGDLDSVTTRVERIEKALKKPTKDHEHEQRELALLKRCQETLEESQPISAIVQSQDEHALVASFSFLTEKPVIAVYNVSEDRAAEPADAPPKGARTAVKLSAEVEAEIAELDDTDRKAFLADIGLEAPAKDRLIKACYEAAGYITFLTANRPETRAWAINAGATALEAAGKVHTDMARGFIRAETIPFDDLMKAGDHKSAKAAGKVHQEGKSYVVQDGDVILFRFNV